MKKFMLILCIILLLCSACALDQPVMPQDIDAAAIIFIAPQKGDAAAEGIPASEVFARVIKAADNSGSLPYTLEAIILDETMGEDQIMTELRSLYTEKTVIGLCGFWDSDIADLILDMPENEKMPTLLWSALREDLISDAVYPYTLRLAPTPRAESIYLLEWLISQNHYTDFAILGDGSSYSNANKEGLISALSAMTDAPSLRQAVDTYDLNGNMLLLKEADLIFLTGEPQNLLGTVDMLKKNNIAADIAAVGAASIANTELPEGIYTVNYAISDYTDFHQNYYKQQAFSAEMGILTPLAYEAAELWLYTVKACGSAPTPYILASALSQISYSGLFGTISFDASGESKYTDMLCVQCLREQKWIELE